MQLPKGIVRRGNKFWVWQRVPSDVRQAFGREFVREAIADRDPYQAIATGIARLAELHAEWNRIRNRGKLTPELRETIVAEFVADHYRYEDEQAATLPSDWTAQQAARTLDEIGDDPAQALSPAGVELMAIAGAADYHADRRERLAAALASGDSRPILPALNGSLATRNLDAAPGSEAHHDLSNAMVRGWIGVLRGQAKPPQPKPAAPAPQPSGPTIMERFEAYAVANPKGITADSINGNRQCVALFSNFMPAGFPASGIEKAHVRDWQDGLRRMPIKASESREFKGKCMRDVLALNEKVGKPVIGRSSVNRYLNGLASFCDWLVRRGELDRNPVDGLRDIIDKTANSPLPYTPDELKRLFMSPLFTGFEADGREHLPGTQRADDWRTWLPLVALYTGARLAEIGQLLVADIRQEAGHWCIHITDAGEHSKTLKTRNSRRIVPVSAELEAAGFVAFVERMRAKGEERLFPELTRDTRGQIGGKPSKWFGRLFRRVGVKDDRRRNFHSLRHGAADSLRRAGFLDSQIGILLGQLGDGSAVTRGYGVLRQGDLKLRLEMVSALSFPETQHLRSM